MILGSKMERLSVCPQQPAVYWIEADEEARLLVPKNPAIMGRRSLLAYLLLRRTVIAHPADFWQSSRTNDLLLNAQAQPLLKEAMQIHLGDSATIQDYMTNRIGKLQRDKASSQNNVELRQYEKYHNALTAQADQLDDVFTSSGATLVTNESRDKKFRKLIRDDLLSDIPIGPQLGGCIRKVLRKNEADSIVKALADLTRDRRRFLSIDGIVFRLVEAGCPHYMVDRIFRRLQLLHWEARKQGNVDVPLLARASAGKLDSADPEVFWMAVDYLVGKEFQQALMALPWQTAVFIACELRADQEWARFIETYEVIVETVERDHGRIAEDLVAADVVARYPTLLRIAINTKPDKWAVLSWVCHAGSWVVGVPNGWSFLFRLGSAAAAIKKGLDHARKIQNALFASERQLITARVNRMIDEATATK